MNSLKQIVGTFASADPVFAMDKTQISPGTYTVTVQSVTANKIISLPVSASVVVKKANPPQADVSLSQNGAVTKNDKLALTLYLPPGTTAVLSHQNSVIRTSLTGKVNEAFILDQGPNIFDLVVTDADGNEAESTFSIYLDQIPPSISIMSIQ